MMALSRVVTQAIPIETLREDISRICGAFEVEPAKRRSSSHGMARKRRIGSFQAAMISLDAKVASRTLKCTRSDPSEHFFMLVQDHGNCVVHQNGAATVLTPGDMFIVDAAQPSDFVFGGKLAHQISLHLPRGEMLGRFGRICSGGIAIERADPIWLAMRAVIAKMLQCNPDTGAPLGEAFFGLLGAYFHERRTQEPDARGLLIERALRLIAQNYRDPDFGPGGLAEHLGVSLRSLQRSFEPLKETPGQRLLRTRLAQAHAELSATAPEAPVANCAYGCGFNDLSYFYRAFRQRYGVTPGDVVPKGVGALVQ